MIDIKDPKMWAAFEKYVEWLSLPRHFSKFSKEEMEEKGFNQDLIELLSIRYKKDFAEHFAVTTETLQDWDKHPDLNAMLKKNWKSWTKKLTPGVMGKFYEKLMTEADPARMKIWMEHVEEENKEDKPVTINLGLQNMLKALNATPEPVIEPKKEDQNG